MSGCIPNLFGGLLKCDGECPMLPWKLGCQVNYLAFYKILFASSISASIEGKGIIDYMPICMYVLA